MTHPHLSKYGVFPPRYALSLIVALAGCGSSAKPGRETVPVAGMVTYQGKPLADANVYFFTEKYSAYGKTDAAGQYRLAQGAMAGENKVFVSKIAGESKVIPEEIASDPGQVAAAAAAVTSDPNRPKKAPSGELLPPEMSNPERTKLTFIVPAEGTETANFSF
jgi:hypothetical protein